MRRKKVVFFYFDGLADEAKPTPLEAAHKPNWNKMARKSLVGTLRLIPPQKPVWSHYATVALLGYDPFKRKIKRGVLEAIAAGYNLKEGHLAVRCNFATLQNGIVVDRRAGRNDYGFDELARDINEYVDLPVPFEFIHTSQHRAVLILKMNLSDEVRCNDPLEEGKKPLEISALKKDALHTAKLLRDFVEQAAELLENHPINDQRIMMGLKPANYILMRDPGNTITAFPRFLRRLNVEKASVISGKNVIKAVFLLAGFRSYELQEEKDVKKYLSNIFDAIDELILENELIVAHIKKTDEFAHDKKLKEKTKLIEMFDEFLYSYLNFKGKVVITTDHITSSLTGKHVNGKVPFMIYNPASNRKGVKKFDEKHAEKTRYQEIDGKRFWKLIFPR